MNSSEQRKEFNRLRGRAFACVILILVSASAFWVATNFGPVSRLVSLYSAAGVAVFAIAGLVRTLLQIRQARSEFLRATEAETAEDEIQPDEKLLPIEAVRYLGWTVLFIVLVLLVDPYVAIAVFIVGFFKVEGGRSWLRSGITAALVMLAAYLIGGTDFVTLPPSRIW